ncbi:DUF1707 SHOCT-like domain-containing protein [Saccharothrix australiensis]|uniref:DUF1707 SHOCT-like domain-containing protein n=1 Tax=Saccharothrix australiensis TaxID=2072 RepID=UPI0014774DF6|nr:DUF1707 domain-containing protein [Saccharothrix australiensis]
MTHPVRPEDVRVSDSEREAVRQLLHRAHSEGSLDLAEFDERVVRAWAARTRGELAALTADLPPVAVTGSGSPAAWRPAPAATARRGGRAAFQVLTAIWLGVSAVNFAIWFLVSLLGGSGLVHPWFLWVALPSGSVLGVVWLVFVRPRR